MSKEYNHVRPSHYRLFCKETIDIMLDTFGKEAVINYCVITAFKYQMRMGAKPDQPADRDIKKRDWYLNKAKELQENA